VTATHIQPADTQALGRPYVDIAFVVPLHEEFQQLTELFPIVSDELEGTQFKAIVETGVPDLTAVAFLQDQMGKAGAARATNSILNAYDVGVIVLIGIAGGLSDDVSIGDVCFTGTVIDVLENAKFSDQKESTVKVEFRPVYHSGDTQLTFALKYLKLSPSLKDIFSEWRERCYYKAAELIPQEFIGRKNKNELISIPEIHDGPIICGGVSKSEIYSSSLKNIDRSLLAIETESGGVYEAAERKKVPAVTIRGICDYADGNKSKLQEQTDNRTRAVAAFNAVSFFKAQLSNPQFIRFLSQRRQNATASGPDLFNAPTDPQILGTAVSQISDQIDRQLRDLSPEYRLRPKGYQLPVPRIRLAPSKFGLTVPAAAKEREKPITILEAIAAHRVLSLNVPRTYPDNSLPWVVAGELLRIELEGKQVLPIVLDGEAIRPPRNTFAREAAIDLTPLSTCPMAQIVFVIDRLPLASKVRIDFTLAELEQYPSAKVVYVNREDANLASRDEFVVRSGAEAYETLEVSFFDLSKFIQLNFSLPDQEAGVLALRLRGLFHRHRLNAHPSYFAGIGADVLASLLHANRRAELIQLAVDGFLSFVVAADKDKQPGDVVLTRTTRVRFLRQLAFEIKAEHKKFARSDLVAFVEEFAKENDYDIDPYLFIQSFLDHGILHFENDVVLISLPFIESYLLASELVARPSEADSYFNFVDDEFDAPTFDLYSELGPAHKLVLRLSSELDKAIDQLVVGSPNTHVMLSDEIRPALVEKPERLNAIQSRIGKAWEDVSQNRPNSIQKQRLLDIVEDIEEKAKGATEDATKTATEHGSNSVELLQDGFRLWMSSCILLGGAAEQLSATEKRGLAQRIVRSTSVLLDRWIRAFPTVEFEKLRSEMNNDVRLRELFGLKAGDAISADLREFVVSLVDALEFGFLSHPLHSMLRCLGDFAGQPVLGASIRNITTVEPMDDLIAAVWAAEINASKSKDALILALDKLPPTPFLRISLATHFMVRVFWNQWNPGNRLALLDAAEASLRPLGGKNIDRGRTIRAIKPSVKTPRGRA
jgi:nucleoside phosphorylase